MLSPLFIVGSPRSGTSILTQALRLADYAGYAEGNFLSLLHTLGNNVDRHFTFFASTDPDVLTTHIDRDTLKSRLFTVLRDMVEERFAGQPWLDKTGNPEMIAAIPILRTLWPHSAFIFAKRRAIENIVSRLKKFPQYDLAYH
jgi:Sulfotransferase family